jgi:hypothetical protein
VSRYQAPRGDGELLAVPPLSELPHLWEANRQLLDISTPLISGLPLDQFRRESAEEAIHAAQAYLLSNGEPLPEVSGNQLLGAGHQPELFHPGVWIKNFVLAQQCRQTNRVGLNLIVDNDTMKAASVAIPSLDPDSTNPIPLFFDGPAGDLPYEERRPIAPEQMEDFLNESHSLTSGFGYRPLLEEAWPKVQAEVFAGATWGEAFSRTRRFYERQWGVHNLELPVSHLASTKAFARFAVQILREGERFTAAYNRSIHDYRVRNHLRSKNHPAPDLAVDNDRFEAPFWIWSAQEPKRSKLWARKVNQCLELFRDQKPIGCLPQDPEKAQEVFRELIQAGWKIRPRALTLTMFTRLALVDGFIHGIGGGKYDEVTDDLIRHFYGIERPQFAVISATLRLPLPKLEGSVGQLHREERRLRDLLWNPQQFTEAQEQFPGQVERKQQLVTTRPTEKRAKVEWFRELHQITEQMRPATMGQSEATVHHIDQIRHDLTVNKARSSREFSWILFPEETLKESLMRVLE